MTLCVECGRDRQFGKMFADGWGCGGCRPEGSVASARNRGNGRVRP
jgi:hypothetical protein